MANDGSKSPVTVLLAEDDEVTQIIVQHILSVLPDVELVVAADGKAALKAALERRFDLMIFDRNMPHIPGDRVIRHLKAARTINAATPVIQFTADADRVTAGQGAASLADATVPKPIRAEEFLAVVNRLLHR